MRRWWGLCSSWPTDCPTTSWPASTNIPTVCCWHTGRWEMAECVTPCDVLCPVPSHVFLLLFLLLILFFFSFSIFWLKEYYCKVPCKRPPHLEHKFLRKVGGGRLLGILPSVQSIIQPLKVQVNTKRLEFKQKSYLFQF